MALVIEAKCLKTAQAIQNASAQAVGYFFKLDQIASLYPPLVIVMTEDWMNVMFFPFKRGTELLANCVEFEHVPLCSTSKVHAMTPEGTDSGSKQPDSELASRKQKQLIARAHSI